MVELLEEADDALIERAASAVQALEPLQNCANVERLLAEVEPPNPGAEQTAVEAVDATVSRSVALRNAGRYRESLVAIESALQDAKKIDYPPIIAECWVQLGIAQERTGQWRKAPKTLHRGAQAAAAAGDESLLALAWIQLGWQREGSRDEFVDPMRWLDYAAATLQHMEPNPRLTHELERARANVHLDAGEYDAALQALARAEVGYEDNYDIQIERGNVLVATSRFAESQAVFDRAAEIVRRTQGPQHPTAGIVANGQGLAAQALGDLDMAKLHYTRAYEIQAAALGEDNPVLLYSLGNLGELHRLHGDYDLALKSALGVLKIVESNYPPVHREVGTTKHNIATILREKGDPQASLAYYAEATRVREQVHGKTHTYLANSLTGHGLALLELSRAQEGLAKLERALAIRNGNSKSLPRRVARTQFGVAQTLTALGQDPARAVELAQASAAALARLDDDGTEARALASSVAKWLAEHDPAQAAESPSKKP